MFVDSHCHIDFPELHKSLPDILQAMQQNTVEYALCISVTLEDFKNVLALANEYEHLFATVGVHPDYEHVLEPTVEGLLELASHPKVVGIGETGLDYYRLTGDLLWQRNRFEVHIQAACESGLPLIIHSRSASEDTLSLLRGFPNACGVFHCFTESWEVAKQALDMGYFISFSGIVTFKNATSLREIAKRIPFDRLLIETDSPYLAPVPHRGKVNQPAWLIHTAAELASVRGVDVELIGEWTTQNFFRLFNKASLLRHC